VLVDENGRHENWNSLSLDSACFSFVWQQVLSTLVAATAAIQVVLDLPEVQVKYV